MTTAQIRSIRYQASLVRDWALVDLCSQALAGNEASRATVAATKS